MISYKINYACMNHEYFINMIPNKIISHSCHVFISWFKILLIDIHVTITYTYDRAVSLIDKVDILYTNFIPVGKAMFLIDASFRYWSFLILRVLCVAIYEPFKIFICFS